MKEYKKPTIEEENVKIEDILTESNKKVPEWHDDNVSVKGWV